MRPRLLGALGTLGHLLALLGAVDPLEGSVAVVAGCLLVALHAWLSGSARVLVAYRTGVAVMAAVGVAVLWFISSRGGLGGPDGVPMTWAFLILPYPAALVAGFSGPGGPPWVAWGGCAVGVGYLGIAAMLTWRPPPQAADPSEIAALLASLGLALLAACAARILLRRAAPPGAP
jgi:hypothetical protein